MVTDVTRALDAVWMGARPSDFESVTLDFKTVGRSIGDTLKDLAELLSASRMPGWCDHRGRPGCSGRC